MLLNFVYAKTPLEDYDEFYGKDKFYELAGEDGVISEEDWVKNRSKVEGLFTPQTRWQEALKYDADGDGMLDLNEAKAYKEAEKKYITKHEKAFRHLYENHKWLMKHPEIVEKLAKNRDWLEKHPKVVKKLYENEQWLIKHPHIAKKLYQNREFLDKHPDIAKRAYKHRKLFKKYPGLTKKAYKHRKLLKKRKRKLKKTYQHPKKAKRLYKKNLNKNKKRYGKIKGQF